MQATAVCGGRRSRHLRAVGRERSGVSVRRDKAPNERGATSGIRASLEGYQNQTSLSDK
jgi:hypothetical protein